MSFDLNKFDVKAFDAILARGLCYGKGKQGAQVCIEAAICETLGLPHSDDPGCVATAVRSFKIALNDSSWSSPEARAKGLRSLGIAQLGSLGVVDDVEFTTKLSKKVIQTLLPKILREVFPKDKNILEMAERCEKEGTIKEADAAKNAAQHAAYAAKNAAKHAAYAAKNAAQHAANAAKHAANAANAADAAKHAANAAKHAANADNYLILAANLALEVLRELNSPGIILL